jgi:hypothetical protein
MAAANSLIVTRGLWARWVRGCLVVAAIVTTVVLAGQDVLWGDGPSEPFASPYKSSAYRVSYADVLDGHIGTCRRDLCTGGGGALYT